MFFDYIVSIAQAITSDAGTLIGDNDDISENAKCVF